MNRASRDGVADSWIAIAANPFSGKGANGERVEQLANHLESHDLESRVSWSRQEHEAMLRDDVSMQSCRCVVAAGGDGTLHAVVNLRPSAPIVQMPLGNENLFANHFNYPADLKQFAALIADGRRGRLDVGEVGDRRFSLMLSVGYDSHVVHEIHAWRCADPSQLRRVSRMTYARPMWRTLRSYRYPQIKVEADGQTITGTHVFVFNLPEYGMGLPFAPEADGTDGELDWIVMERPGALAMGRYALAVKRGRHFAMKDVHHGRAKSIRIMCEQRLPVQADGDPAGFTPCDIRVVPGGLRVVVRD